MFGLFKSFESKLEAAIKNGKLDDYLNLKLQPTKKDVDRLNLLRELKMGWSSILNYGATTYKSIEHSKDGQRDSSQSIQDMEQDLGLAMLPPIGNFWLDKETTFYKANSGIMQSGKSNISVNLSTDKAINMFKVTHEMQEVSGFTANYFGSDIKDCAVVYAGGKHKGAIDIRRDGTPYHHWANRSRLIGNIFDFNFKGDETYGLSRKVNTPYPYNEKFIKNYGAHAVWIDYENEDTGDWSHAHLIDIKGYWKLCNTGVKISRKASVSLNTFDLNFKIWGFREIVNIDGIDNSIIQWIGQHQDTLDWNSLDPKYENSNKENWEEWALPAFHIKGSNITITKTEYDRKHTPKRSAHHGVAGDLFVKRLKINNILPYFDADLNDSILV